jgi:hypothetical protein
VLALKSFDVRTTNTTMPNTRVVTQIGGCTAKSKLEAAKYPGIPDLYTPD